ELADDLVAGDERHRHERREVEGRSAGERREVAPADAREHRLHARPAGAVLGRHRVLQRREPEGREGTGHEAARAVPNGARGYIPWGRTEQLERERHQLVTSSPASGSARAACPSTSTTPRWATAAASRTGTGLSPATRPRGSRPRAGAAGPSASPR